MRRFSIAELMTLVAFCALSFAALRYPSPLSVAGIRLLTFGMIGYSILAIVYEEGAKRAGHVGFSIFAIGFFVARVIPVIDETYASDVIRCQGALAAGLIGALIAVRLYRKSTL